ncbi:MAG: DUF3788 family protein [Pyrinomonadaceae bacterium]
MAFSAFADKAHQPTEKDLRSVLGKSYPAWVRLIELVSNRISRISQVWGFTSASTGWGLRLKRNDRVILYMTPREDHFLVSFALGEKAVAAARVRQLPTAVLKAIESAPKYAEGRGVRLEVRQAREVAALATLAEIKDEH